MNTARNRVQKHRRRGLRNRANPGASYRSALTGVVSAMDIPFGYTLTVWSAGVVAVKSFGFPSLLDIVLFLGGAVVAYVSLSFLSGPSVAGGEGLRRPRVSVLNVVALVAALLAVGLGRLITTAWLGFLVLGFTSTAIYPVLLALLSFFEARITAWKSGRNPNAGS